MKGQRLIGLFTNNELDTVNINKNAEVIFYSRNDKKELVGINNTVSSSIQLYLENQKIVGVRFIKKANGKVYPPSKFPPNARQLPGFKWRGDERLFKKTDLFKGKPAPVLTKIKGIPLPKDEGEFFDDIPIEELNIPEASKLLPKDIQTNPDDPKPMTRESEENKEGLKTDTDPKHKISKEKDNN